MSTMQGETRVAGLPYNCIMLSLPAPLTRIKQAIQAPAKSMAGDRAWISPGRLRLRARMRVLRRQLAPIQAVELTRRTWRELGDDHSVDLAASIAYYSVLSLLPLAIGLVTLFSLVLEAEVVEQEVYSFFHTYLPGSEGILEANVEAVNNIRGVLGILSVLGIIWSSTLIFGAVTRAVNRAWDIEYDRPFFIAKPRHLLMAISITPFFVVSMVLTTGLQFLENDEIPLLGSLAFLENNGINALARPVPFLFSLVIFLLIYKFTPITRTYWRFIWPGALVAALLFEAAKSVFIFYLDHYAAYERIYGTLASVIALLAWAYVSGFIVVIGAEVSSEYFRMRMGTARGRPVNPRRRRRLSSRRRRR